MRVTQQLRYSLHGVFDLAYHGSAGPICVEEIGRRQGIPARYLEQILQKLRRAGLVVSKRGPGGGYLLARPPDAISLADVFRAVQGDVVRSAHDPDDVASEGSFIQELLRERVERALEGPTIATLCQEAERRGLERSDAPPLMFEI